MEPKDPIRLEQHVDAIRDVLNTDEYASHALQPETVNNHAPISKNGDSGKTDIPSSSQTFVEAQATNKPETSQAINVSSDSGHNPASIDNDNPLEGSSARSERAGAKRRKLSSAEEQVEQEMGHKPEIRDLYKTVHNKDTGEIVWSTRAPVTSHRINEKDETAEYAILRYHETLINTSSIKVQSPQLKDCLVRVFSDYPQVNTALSSLEFDAPFTPFVHRWQRLLQEEETLTGIQRDVMRLLRRSLESDLKRLFLARQELLKTGYISFRDILLAFVPGEVVLRRKHDMLYAGVLQSARIVEGTFVRTCRLKVKTVDWDGSRFGYRQKVWEIAAFNGLQNVNDLQIYPLELQPDKKDIMETLIKRGRCFETLSGQHIMNYTGLVHARVDYRPKTISLSERIIVDAEASYRFRQQSRPTLKALDGKKETNTSSAKGSTVTQSQKPTTLTDEHCMLTNPRVKGFALKTKAWYKFAVTSITPTIWNETLLSNLVIDDKEKRLLLALTENIVKQEERFDDFIEGKGNGLILLLAGPPGVGKTLTSESVAEELKRPLYRISAGDLGLSASKVESSLKEAFARCCHWNAVLLIDEADVFLEKRSSDRLTQNELVSIFLTTLEYYEGVLILTTNRTGDIDPAFESRIDIVLTYSELSKEARRQIWVNFVKRLPANSVNLNDADLDYLSERNINGRQIKSAIKTASIMATSEDVPLSMSQLEVVLEIRRKGSKVLGAEQV